MSLEQTLASIPLFRQVEPKVRRSLAERGTRRTYAPEQTIVRQGDNGTGFYVVLSGRARVERSDAHGTHDLGQVGPGAFFGELSLIEERPRSATVTAVDETECLIWPAWDFLPLVDRHPEVAVPIMMELIRRLHRVEAEA
jgi:CRP/FNR family transcriptional regulator, cyclic AMP receptor protein